MSVPASQPRGVPTSPEKRIYVNSGYIRSIHGILKCTVMGVSLVTFITMMTTSFTYHSVTTYSVVISMTGFWMSGLLLFLYVINAVTFLTDAPWVVLELFYTGVMCFLTFVAGCVTADARARGFDVPHGICAFLFFVLAIIFGVNAFILFQLKRKGVRLVTTETTTITSGQP